MTSGRTARIWGLIAEESLGSPVSVAHVCAAVVAAVEVDGASLTIMVSPTVRDAVHVTDSVAAELEEWQLTFGQGPCVDAFATGGPVLVADLHTPALAARWPAFTPAAASSGAGAVFALPLQVGAIRLGVLALYRRRPGALDRDEVADALAFADVAGALLLDRSAGRVQPEDAWQDEDPTAHQAEVHQATGMILAQLGVSAAAAFARLRAHAYAHDRRLGDVARDVVERRLRFEPEPVAGDGE
ncbi:GAF domain-containing protein [Longispora urticae]